MDNTLIVALVSYAGMGPYVTTIINSFKPSDPVYFFLLDNSTDYYKKNVKPELKKNCLITKINSSKIEDIKNLIFSNSKLGNDINDFAIKNNIKNIHFITAENRIRGMIDRWKKKFNLFMTIHDLAPHEMNKAIHKEIKQKIIYRHLNSMTDKIDNLITNSKDQLLQLNQKYPKKNCYLHEFPTLITKEIENGNLQVPELKGITNYILFFGRIESYKGLHILYEAWMKDEDIHNKYKLVIAGSGDNYINRCKDEKNIIFINRYIKDEEVKALFENAILTVYPYISATQSGVLSLSSYFGIPILASDIHFFRHISESGIGVTFKNQNATDLAQKLKFILQQDLSSYKQQESKYYQEKYNSDRLRTRLMEIYTNINKTKS